MWRRDLQRQELAALQAQRAVEARHGFQQRFDPLPKFGISAADFIKKCTSLFRIVFFECFEKDCSFVHNQITPHMPVLQIYVSKGSAKSSLRIRQLF